MILQLLVCQSATGKLEKQHSSLFNDCHVILGNCPLSILAFHYCSITSSKISPFILLTYLDTGNVFLYRIIPGAGGNRGLAATISRSVVDKYFPFVRAAGKSSRCTIRGDSTQSFLYGRWMKALCGIARRGGGGGEGRRKTRDSWRQGWRIGNVRYIVCCLLRWSIIWHGWDILSLIIEALKF